MQSLIQAVHSLPSAMSIDKVMKSQKHCYTSSKTNEGPQIEAQHAARENITIVLEDQLIKNIVTKSTLAALAYKRICCQICNESTEETPNVFDKTTQTNHIISIFIFPKLFTCMYKKLASAVSIFTTTIQVQRTNKPHHTNFFFFFKK